MSNNQNYLKINNNSFSKGVFKHSFFFSKKGLRMSKLNSAVRIPTPHCTSDLVSNNNNSFSIDNFNNGVFPFLPETLKLAKLDSAVGFPSTHRASNSLITLVKLISLAKLIIISMVLLASIAIAPITAMAQTAIATPNQAGNQNYQQPNSQMPVAQSTIDQTQDHIEGNYTPMTRVAAGGQIQSAWDEVDINAGQFSYEMCQSCTYKVLTREYMVTVIELPENEIINAYDIGQAAAFIITKPEKNKLAIRPNGFGMDSNLIVYGKDGRHYSFYLRAEGVNSNNIPDFVIKIDGKIPAKITENSVKFNNDNDANNSQANDSQSNHNNGDKLSKIIIDDIKPPTKKTNIGDFVTEIPFDPDKLHGWDDYEIWGENWPENWLPEVIFRDEVMTYIRFGDNWAHLELPTAYVVIDDIDENVNTRISGTTFIIESTNGLITLKSGEKYLCIKFKA